MPAFWEYGKFKTQDDAAVGRAGGWRQTGSRPERTRAPTPREAFPVRRSRLPVMS